MFDVNVLGTKRAVTALLPSLRGGAEEARGADIVTVTSLAGHVAYENGGGYNASKFAEHALVAVLRLELAGEPIRVIEIAPGMVHTEEFSLVRFGGDQDRADAVYRDVEAPLTADDVAIEGTDAVLAEVKELAAGGSFGSIMGRNAFQRPRADALKLLGDVMQIYKSAR